MAETTIEWTVTVAPDGRVFPGFTFNAWRGCMKISPGCANCYAESLDQWLHGGKHWGPDGVRGQHGEEYWKKPLGWNRKAEKLGVRLKVFTNSIADVFEDRPELAAPRARLFGLIRATPHIDWLVLTKRPENIAKLIRLAIDTLDKAASTSIERGNGEEHRRSVSNEAEGGERDCNQTHLEASSVADWLRLWLGGAPPPNVWLGTTVEDQQRADERIPHLLAVPAAVRFLSCEPLLGPLDLSRWLGEGDSAQEGCGGAAQVDSGGLRHIGQDCIQDRPRTEVGFSWLIAGGESGHGARPMHPMWAHSIRDQCAAAGVPFLFKQWGEFEPGWDQGSEDMDDEMMSHLTKSERKGLRVLPGGLSGDAALDAEMFTVMVRNGKAKTGRHLDGRTHDEFPEVRR